MNNNYVDANVEKYIIMIIHSKQSIENDWLPEESDLIPCV